MPRTSTRKVDNEPCDTATEIDSEVVAVCRESESIDGLVRRLLAVADGTETTSAVSDPADFSDYLRQLTSALGRGLPVGVDRDDLWQEALVSLCDLFAAGRAPVRPGSEEVRVTVRRQLNQFLRDEARRAGRTGRHSDRLRELAAEASRSSRFAEPLRGCSPRMRSALRGLTPRQRSVIDGYYWRDRTTSALSSELGVSQAAITATRRRAEAALRALLGPDSV